MLAVNSDEIEVELSCALILCVFENNAQVSCVLVRREGNGI